LEKAFEAFLPFDWSEPYFAEAQQLFSAPVAPLTTGVSIFPNRCATKSPTGWRSAELRQSRPAA
jgi:hypothetical protein